MIMQSNMGLFSYAAFSCCIWFEQKSQLRGTYKGRGAFNLDDNAKLDSKLLHSVFLHDYLSG